MRGKRKKKDVQEFQYRLMDNVLALHAELANGKYKHGSYQHFRISDPKPRDIHKASVRDRLVHHALHRKLYPFFDKTFISDSYSCRKGKGTHRAMNRFREYAYKVSKNNTRTCWVLKCDIRKFFASVDHRILFDILSRTISDERITALLTEVIGSFQTHEATPRGLPLGNLTSQLLVNVYMNEFDQFAKYKLKARYYVRYADDFVVLSHNKGELERTVSYMGLFLRERLALELHPDKVFIKTLASGVDFLGWVHFLDHRVLRTSTKQRMLKRVEGTDNEDVVNSYRGLLSDGNATKLSHALENGRPATPKWS